METNQTTKEKDPNTTFLKLLIIISGLGLFLNFLIASSLHSIADRVSSFEKETYAVPVTVAEEPAPIEETPSESPQSPAAIIWQQAEEAAAIAQAETPFPSPAEVEARRLQALEHLSRAREAADLQRKEAIRRSEAVGDAYMRRSSKE